MVLVRRTLASVLFSLVLAIVLHRRVDLGPLIVGAVFVVGLLFCAVAASAMEASSLPDKALVPELLRARRERRRQRV
jgi:hypothetical protein